MTAGDGWREADRGPSSDAAIGEPAARHYALLTVGDRRLAVGIENVERVLHAVELVDGDLPLPLIGFVNLHGEMIPALDLRRRVGVESRDLRLSDRLVLLRRGPLRCFAIADAVAEMVTIPDSIARDAGRGAVDGCSAEVALEDGAAAFLDLARLLDAAEVAQETKETRDPSDGSQSSDDGDGERAKRLLRARAEALARPLAGEQSESTVDLVTLHIDGFDYAIEATLVREVYAVRQVTPLPTAPEFVLGITNIRGKIIAVLDVAALLGHATAGRASGRIIVVEIGGIEVGVDARECGIARVPHHRLRPPSRGAQERDRYLKLTGGDDLGVLDLERIIAEMRRTAAPLEARAER